jgi:hypothetical protein
VEEVTSQEKEEDCFKKDFWKILVSPVAVAKHLRRYFQLKHFVCPLVNDSRT